MNLGIALPCFGENANPDAVSQVARRAEALGFDSVWAIERTLFPVARHQELASPSSAVKPFDALTIAAASTTRIGLGVSMLNIPFHSPTALARSLGALDAASNGRARLGLGLGFTAEEFVNVSNALANPHSLAGEFLVALESICSENARGYHGEHFSIPSGCCTAPARRRSHPPVQLTAFAPAAVLKGRSLLNYRDSPTPAAADVAEIVEILLTVVRDSRSNSLPTELVIRVNPRFGAPMPDSSRPLFTGSFEQVLSDILAIRATGATELLIDFEGAPASEIVQRMNQVSELLPSFAMNRVAVAA